MLFEVLNSPRVQLWVLTANKTQLYAKGKTSKGKDLGKYSPYTEEVKKSKGQRLDHITLSDTGAFYESFKLIIGKNSFEITADGIKVDDYGNITDLLYEYGEDVLGLDQEHLQDFVIMLTNEMIKHIERKLINV